MAESNSASQCFPCALHYIAPSAPSDKENAIQLNPAPARSHYVPGEVDHGASGLDVLCVHLSPRGKHDGNKRAHDHERSPIQLDFSRVR